MVESPSRSMTVLAVLLGALMVGSGVMKVAGESHQVAAFAAWALPPWFRLLVGTFEIVGGVLLLVPQTSPVGSMILSTIMVGAIWTHVAAGEWSHLVPVAVMLVLFVLIFRSNQLRLVRLLGVV
jgi:uncharacterized membrane protein YphA (DoxX/SURF4 family)